MESERFKFNLLNKMVAVVAHTVTALTQTPAPYVTLRPSPTAGGLSYAEDH